jgi:peptide methionine sulfoxide reductase MsrB
MNPCGLSKEEETESRISVLDEEGDECAHLNGYWINRNTGNFRCYGCGFQFFTRDLKPNRGREIERRRQ